MPSACVGLQTMYGALTPNRFPRMFSFSLQPSRRRQGRTHDREAIASPLASGAMTVNTDRQTDGRARALSHAHTRSCSSCFCTARPCVAVLLPLLARLKPQVCLATFALLVAAFVAFSATYSTAQSAWMADGWFSTPSTLPSQQQLRQVCQDARIA